MSVQMQDYYCQDQQPYNGGYIYSFPPVKQFKEQLYVCKRKRDENEQQDQIQTEKNKKFKHEEPQLGFPMKQIKVLVDGLEFNKYQFKNDTQIQDMVQNSGVVGNQSGAIILYKAPEEILGNSIQKWKHEDVRSKSDLLINRDQSIVNGCCNYENNCDDDSQDEMEID